MLCCYVCYVVADSEEWRPQRRAVPGHGPQSHSSATRLCLLASSRLGIIAPPISNIIISIIIVVVIISSIIIIVVVIISNIVVVAFVFFPFV